MIQNTLNRMRSLAPDFLSQRLNRNVGWLTLAEMVSRVGRIVAAIVLARELDATAFGIAAIAITVFELVRVFTENGIGAAVIRAKDFDVDRIANTAYRLMWAICLGLAAIQLCVGFILELLMPGRQVGLMVASLCLVFLIMPFGLLHAYSLLRDQRMKRLAAIASAQSVADHLLTAAFALSGFGAWAIVLPKVLTTPIWLFGVRHSKPWIPRPEAGLAPVHQILKFSIPVLGAELFSAFRDHLDKLVISFVLGVDALGIYYFAFNAGLGISTALNRAFSNAIYPHLCAATDRLVAYRKALLGLGGLLGLAYCAQAAAALFYVPYIFGADWAATAPLVALLCLGGPARLLVDGARMKARAEGRSGLEFRTALFFTLSILMPFTLTAPFGLFQAALASVIGATLYGFIVTLSILRSLSNRPASKLETVLC